MDTAKAKTSTVNKKICADVLMILTPLFLVMANSHNIGILPNCEANGANNVAFKSEKAGPLIYYSNPAVSKLYDYFATAVLPTIQLKH